MATLLHMPASPSLDSNYSRPSASPLPGPPASFSSRPGLRRNASSSSIILSPVLRFSPASSFIPSPSEVSILQTSDKSYMDHSTLPAAAAAVVAAKSPSESSSTGAPLTTRCSFQANLPSPRDEDAASEEPVTSSSSLNRSASTSSSSSSTSGRSASAGGSLLARRRSSAASGKRPDIFALTMKIPDLPTAPLDEIFDDTIPAKVIGVASAAVTPSAEDLNLPHTPVVVVKEFKSTKSFVPTPFPEKTSFLDDEDDEDDDDDDLKDSRVSSSTPNLEQAENHES